MRLAWKHLLQKNSNSAACRSVQLIPHIAPFNFSLAVSKTTKYKTFSFPNQSGDNWAWTMPINPSQRWIKQTNSLQICVQSSKKFVLTWQKPSRLILTQILQSKPVKDIAANQIHARVSSELCNIQNDNLETSSTIATILTHLIAPSINFPAFSLYFWTFLPPNLLSCFCKVLIETFWKMSSICKNFQPGINSPSLPPFSPWNWMECPDEIISNQTLYVINFPSLSMPQNCFLSRHK